MLHDDEIPIDLDLVRALVDSAGTAWRDLPLSPLPASGSSNALFRLGDDFLVRLPRQPGGSAGIEKEARWQRFLADALPVQTPEVLHLGEPGHGYPERWSVVRWIDGTTPTPWGPNAAAGGARPALVRGLATVLAALRDAPVPTAAQADESLSSYRAEPLEAMADQTREDLAACRAIDGLDLDVDRALAVWDDLLEQQRGASSPRTWLHSDLLAENLLVRDDSLVAVLDFGGLAVGDPAVDLTAVWELLGPDDREWLRRELDVDDAVWARGRGWALAIAAMTFPYYWHTMPGRCSARLTMLRNVLTA